MKTDKARFILGVLPSTFFLIVIWAIKGLEIALDTSFHQLGVFPRKLSGLIGILSAPIIHGSVEHLWSNSVPILVLGTALFYFYRKIAFELVVIIYLVSGIWVWLFAVPGYHIGASGLIYGLAFFLFFSGVIRRKRELMAVSLLVVILYGSIIWGLLPYDPSVSWQTHLFGAIIGTMMAYYYGRKLILRRKHFSHSENTNATMHFVDENNREVSINYVYKENSKMD